MASERIKKVEYKDFPGINRSGGEGSSVSRDGRRVKLPNAPDGSPRSKFVRRAEYDLLYDYRNQQFEHTTDNSSREVRGDGAAPEIPNTHEVYRSHGRKMIALGKNGNPATEYVFTGYVEEHQSAQQWTLHIERGTRAAGALDVTWVAAGAGCRLDAVSTPAHAGYLNDWIEFSMVMNAAKSAIHLIVTIHETQAPTSTVVQHYSLTDIYNATVGNITVNLLENEIESSTDITRDVDIEIGSGDALYAVWGKAIGGDDSIMRASGTAGGVWGAPVAYTQFGLDMYGLSIVKVPGASAKLYITYTLTEGGLRKLNYIGSTDGLVTIGAQSQVVTNLLTGGTDFYYRGVFAVDTDGSLHWVYLDADGKLSHIWATSAGSLQIPSLAITAAVDTTLTNEQTTGWDFVVKNGCVTVFYVDDTLPLRTYKAVRVITSGDPEAGLYNRSDYTGTIQHDLVEVRGTGNDARYFATYRKYEQNTSLRLSWVSCDTEDTVTNVRYLHSDKGLYEIDDSHTATNGVYVTTRQVAIEAMDEPLISDADGALSQILILQCSDNRLYKRVNYMWMLLEGQRLIDNSGWNWTTVYDDHVRFLRYAGTVRMMAGDGATNQNAWYGYVDRDFFDNGADVNTHSTNRYVDHASDLARPDVPATTIYDSISASNAALGDRYTVFGSNEIQREYPYLLDEDVPEGGRRLYGYFFLAFTLEYDGVVESQLRYQVSDDPLRMGFYGRDSFSKFIRIIFDVYSWNSTNADRISPRVTGICIYMAIKQLEGDDKTTVQYHKVKRCQVAKAKPTGENAFEDDDYEGTAFWTAGAGSGQFNLTTYVDFSMWDNRVAQGSAEDNLGTSLVRYRSAASGTEVYTKLTGIPEGFKYAIVLQDEVWVASVRLAGVTRKNRLMRSARKLGSQVTPDALTTNVTEYRDFPYDILGLSQIDDSNLVVIGRNGIDIFDISGGQLNKRDDITDVGTDATDSVYYLKEGAVGKILKGVIFKDKDGNIRLFDGYGAAIISDPIRDNFALTSDGVDTNNYGVLSLNATTLITTYVPLQRTLWLIYRPVSPETTSQVYVLDLASGGDWQNWKLSHTIVATCQGVDGELFLSEGSTVEVWPQVGSIDTPNPLWRGSDVRAPEDMRVIPKNVWMDYICSTTTLQPKVWKDRGAVTDSSATLAASPTQETARTSYARSGSAARREIAIGFGVTTASSLTSLEVDSLVQELLIIPRRP